MNKISLIYRSVCIGVALLLAFSVGIFLASAEGVTEPLSDVIFYDADALDSIKKWGHDTQTSRSVDEKTGVSALRLTPSEEKADPYLTFYPTESISAEDYPFVALLVKKRSQLSDVQLFFRTDKHDKFTEQASKKGTYNPNNKWQIIVFEMSDLSEWSGSVTVLRLDYLARAAGSDDYCDLAGIALGKSENAVLDAASGFFAEKLGAVQRFSNFSDIEIGYFSSAYQTTVSLTDGALIYEAIGSPKGSAFDPQAIWRVEEFCEFRGVAPLFAYEFTHLVITQRAHVEHDIQQMFEIFYQTGDRYAAQGGFSAREDYRPSGKWQSVTLDFSRCPEWNGIVHSLRLDWANSFVSDSRGSMEVLEFVFFGDSKSAARYADIINNIVVYAVDREGNAEEETWVDGEDGTLDVGTFGEDNTEAQETTEETLPEFIETTEEPGEDITEEPSENITEESDENITEETSDDVGGDGAEEKSEGKPVGPITPDAPMPLSDTVEGEGSQAPFIIACVILAMLSVASIVTVIVIKKKNK